MHKSQWLLSALPVALAQLRLCDDLWRSRPELYDAQVVMKLAGIVIPTEDDLEDIQIAFGLNGPDFPVGCYAYLHLRKAVLERIEREGHALPGNPADLWMDDIWRHDLVEAILSMETAIDLAYIHAGEPIGSLPSQRNKGKREERNE